MSMALAVSAMLLLRFLVLRLHELQVLLHAPFDSDHLAQSFILDGLG